MLFVHQHVAVCPLGHCKNVRVFTDGVCPPRKHRGRYGGNIVDSRDNVIWVEGHQNIAHKCVNIVAVIPAAKYIQKRTLGEAVERRQIRDIYTTMAWVVWCVRLSSIVKSSPCCRFPPIRGACAQLCGQVASQRHRCPTETIRRRKGKEAAQNKRIRGVAGYSSRRL